MKRLKLTELESPSNRHFITLHIGLNLPDSSSVVAKRAVMKFLKSRFESFSITEAIGFFRGIQEPTLIVSIASTDPQSVADTATALRERFGWEGVGIIFKGKYYRATADTTPVLRR